MKRFSLLLKLTILLILPVSAQPYSFPELKGYRIVSNYPVFTPDNLWDFIDGAADGYLSYGFQNVHVREYVKGKDVIKVEIYRHKDRNNTFGIYASERSPSYRYINIGAQGYITEGILNFFKNLYYVKIRTFSRKEKVLRDMESLAFKVADMLPGEATMPHTLAELPENNKEKYSETYIGESVLGHEFLSEAYRAEYKLDGISFSLFIFDKPSSGDILKMVRSYLSTAGLEPVDPDEGKMMFKDGYNGNIFLAWKGTRMILITGLEKDRSDVADRYINEILR
jgi:hypothetical protein